MAHELKCGSVRSRILTKVFDLRDGSDIGGLGISEIGKVLMTLQPFPSCPHLEKRLDDGGGFEDAVKNIVAQFGGGLEAIRRWDGSTLVAQVG